MSKRIILGLLAAVLPLAVGIALFLGPDLMRLASRPSLPKPSPATPGELFSGEGRTPTADDFAPIQVVDQRPAITEIKTVAADQVTHEVQPDELVLGVVIDGQARGYPINVLTTPAREVFNDVLADQPIAATW